VSSFGNDAARRGERGGRKGKSEGEGSDTVEGGVSEVVPSSSSAVATGHSRPLALAGLLSRREDTVTARGRLFVLRPLSYLGAARPLMLPLY
jgi:hypothetical protein